MYLRNISAILKRVENPARYVGGEFGIIRRNASLACAVCFPDLYEIGMSNQAVAILYGMLNSLEGVSCERVFCPAEDFENELKQAAVPLYGLETGKALNTFDIVAFTIGYELSATNVLTMLDRGCVPLRSENRSASDPIVIAGGPAITNPLPFAAVFDAVYAGEAEGEFRTIAAELAALKKKGASRQDLLARIRESSSFWYPGRTNPALRSVWMGFPASFSPGLKSPTPNLRTVQDHGVVEIMRGCPHGCRFCHAGVYYRPYRMKKCENIYQEVHDLIHLHGYREITLSSLSSGDFTDIGGLVRFLNDRHKGDQVSFSLPSLHLESFGLQILSEISAVRKSGLTFAVETPRPEFQRSLNKPVSREKIVSVLREAKRQGWKLAKFYFMIGLPFDLDGSVEADEIIGFVKSIHETVKINLHINVGTFIPKPHTPYQWAGQLAEKESLERLLRIKRHLVSPAIRVGYHSPFQSYLEGIISRGDERVGELLFAAYDQGARFDAWEERSHSDIWRTVLESAPWDAESYTCDPRPRGAALPWQKAFSLGPDAAYFPNEWRLHTANTLTAPCGDPCPHPCGVCDDVIFPVATPTVEGAALEIGGGGAETAASSTAARRNCPRLIIRHICAYEKTGKAAFLPHLSLMQVMERSLLRAGILSRFTEGFNPKPVLEFAQPSSVGVESLDEIFSFETYFTETQFEPPSKEVAGREKFADGPDAILAALNWSLPEGLTVKTISSVRYREKGKKPPSLMSLYAGGRYELTAGDDSLIQKTLEAFAGNNSCSIVDQNPGRLVLDYISGANAKGFWFILKAALKDDVSALSIRKLSTYARHGDTLGSYAEIAVLLNENK
jgi:radical SAM superfamily enzyme YgiQ (UPF0313 family)